MIHFDVDFLLDPSMYYIYICIYVCVYICMLVGSMNSGSTSLGSAGAASSGSGRRVGRFKVIGDRGKDAMKSSSLDREMTSNPKVCTYCWSCLFIVMLNHQRNRTKGVVWIRTHHFPLLDLFFFFYLAPYHNYPSFLSFCFQFTYINIYFLINVWK